MPRKHSGYTGWKKNKRKKHAYDMFLKKIKVAEAEITRTGNKWKAEVRAMMWEIRGVFRKPFDNFKDAEKWLNSQRRFLTKKVFG